MFHVFQQACFGVITCGLSLAHGAPLYTLAKELGFFDFLLDCFLGIRLFSVVNHVIEFAT